MAFTMRPGTSLYNTYATAALRAGKEHEGYWPTDTEIEAAIASGAVTPQMIAAQLPGGRANLDGSVSYEDSGLNGYDFGDTLLSAFAAAVTGGGLGGGFQGMGVTGAVPGGGGSVLSQLLQMFSGGGGELSAQIPGEFGFGEGLTNPTGPYISPDPWGATTGAMDLGGPIGFDPVDALNQAGPGSITKGVTGTGDPFFGQFVAPALAGAAALGGSFKNADGSYGSTVANSQPGGVGTTDPAGASPLVPDWLKTGAGSAVTGSALSRILNGTATADDWLKLGGTALSGGLGAYAANEQSKTLAELAREQQGAEKARYDDLVRRESERYADLKAREDVAIGKRDAAIQFGREVGAPSRARYEGSYAPGFTMAQDPGYTDALDQTAKATLHGLSVNGNPAGSPNAWATTLKDLYEKTAYPALQTYRSNNATTGGFGAYAGEGATVPGIGSALPGSTSDGKGSANSQIGFETRAASTGADANVWNALGTAAGDVFAPKKQLSLADLMKQFANGGSAVYTVA